jgi:NTP pyrophosphatase (non-canonical NTP hydrolase)
VHNSKVGFSLLFGHNELMKNLDLERLMAVIDNFSTERDWAQFHSVKNLSMALSVEACELMEIFQWMKEEESNRFFEDPLLCSKVQDEVADVFIYLLRIVSKGGFDLEEAVLQKMKKNAKKYPVKLAKGTSKKYNQLK